MFNQLFYHLNQYRLYKPVGGFHANHHLFEMKRIFKDLGWRRFLLGFGYHTLLKEVQEEINE